jgi:hypothetical protein
LYADDLVVFISLEHQDLFMLRQVLDMFQVSSSLSCNLAYKMVAIRCNEEQITQSAEEFPCQLVQFPIKYLGLPLSVFKLPKSAMHPLVDHVVDRLLAWKGRLLHRSGHLTLIKTTLTAVLVYTAISLGLPLWLIKSLQKKFKAFLWTGTKEVQCGKCNIAWSRVQCPLQLEGLGILDLRLLGLALRVHWLWLERTEPSQPWVALVASMDKLTSCFFKNSISLVLRDSNNFLFWSNPWIDGKGITDLASDLLDAVPMCRWRQRTVASTVSEEAWAQDILGPLTIPVIMQFLDIHQCVQ